MTAFPDPFTRRGRIPFSACGHLAPHINALCGRAAVTEIRPFAPVRPRQRTKTEPESLQFTSLCSLIALKGVVACHGVHAISGVFVSLYLSKFSHDLILSEPDYFDTQIH